jgi:FlaA1/EpsC-like NDP-sugar epimerase
MIDQHHQNVGVLQGISQRHQRSAFGELRRNIPFLVTGGAGFIGSALVRFLIANTDHRVVVVDKLSMLVSTKAIGPSIERST